MQQLEQEARALRDQGEWDKALQLCDGVLLRDPKNPAFTALRREFVLNRRKAVMELIRQLETQLRSEPHFEKRLELIGPALKRFPNELFFKQSFSETNQALDQVRALASKAHRTADDGQFEEALGILDTISGISSEYSPLEAERERIKSLQEKAMLARKKARRVIGIRTALTRKDIEAARHELQAAFEEFSNDDELLRLQLELTQLEEKTKEANKLYAVGCHQISAGEYEAGIATLRQANRLDSKSRPIEMALFNALVQFAKLIVDFEHERARHLLDEAAQLSPLNLTLESASKYLSDRILECAVTDCRLRVQVLYESGQIHEALLLVSALADRFQIHDNPLIEEIRTEIWTNSRGASESKQNVRDISAADEPGLESRAEKQAVEPRKLWTVVENWKVRERSRLILQMLATEKQTLQAQLVQWRDLSRSAFSRLPKGYKLGIGGVGLLLIVATTVVSTSLRSQPDLPSVGTATMLSSVTLRQEPSTSSSASGTLKIGQSVELLTQLPAMTPDAWVLIRTNGDTQSSGYVRLQNLDHIKTGNPQFDLWHAMQLSDDADELRESIHNTLITLAETVDEPVSLPPAIRTRDEESRIMGLAKKAYAQRTFETSAEYSAQVLKMNGGNLEARKLLDASRQAQADLEAAITGR